MHVLCLNDFSCLDALVFVAEIVTIGSSLELLSCVKFIAPENVLCYGMKLSNILMHNK